VTLCLNGGLDLGQRRVLGVSQQTVSVNGADEVWLFQRMPLLIGLLLQIREDGGISNRNKCSRWWSNTATELCRRLITFKVNHLDDVSNRSFTSASLGNPFQEDVTHSEDTTAAQCGEPLPLPWAFPP
jgi:hypothetical protein